MAPAALSAGARSGGFASLMLGSVAISVLHRVAGPVLFVPRSA
jgi:nucleotide-binding universal stress UspA family protein